MTALERIAAYDRHKKESKIAKDTRNNKSVNQPSNYVGRPQGPKAKGHKTPATGTLPYVRRSVIG